MAQASAATAGPEEEVMGAAPAGAVLSRDRAIPAWARPLAAIFSTGIAACLVAFCIGALLVQDLVVEGRAAAVAPVLAGLSLIPAAGLVILEHAQARALAGWRLEREAWSEAVQAIVAAVTVVAMGFLHPLLAAAPIAGVALGAGVVALAARVTPEPLWDFLPDESVPVLTGRDALGFRLAATAPRTPTLLAPALRALRWLVLACTLAAAGWLAAREVLASAAVPAAGLIGFWAMGPIFAALARRSRADPLRSETARAVIPLEDGSRPGTETIEEEPLPGSLEVRGLSITAPGGWPLLSDVSFTLGPGEIIGIEGPPGSGKSLLTRALVAPQDLAGLEVRGAVRLSGANLWETSPVPTAPRAALVPPDPPMLPAAGADNLAFFDRGASLERARRILEGLVFATDTVDRLCAAPDATRLSSSERKAIGLARALLLSPPLLILDRPEDAAPEKLVAALATRLRQEARAGRTIFLVTASRALLELCDRLIVLSEGRLVDIGPASEIRARQSAGWFRFVGARALETEETLETWIRSHFRRDGDEINRRNACLLAAELLAFSCTTAPPLSRQTLYFEFKHFEGHCIIRLIDQDPALSSATLARARAEAEAARTAEGEGRPRPRLSPLATVLTLAEEVSATVENGHRVITARLATYDPRKTGGKPPEGAIKASPLLAAMSRPAEGPEPDHDAPDAETA